MSFTSLHRALGIQPCPLSFEMLADAVEQAVAEQTDLDWKAKLPDNRDPAWREEFAKDIAAMANVGGGLIVYGVKEDTRSAATELLDTGSWTDSKARKLRQAAHALIQPTIQGLEFTALTQDDVTLVVLSVPASTEVPHFQMNRDLYRAPRRYGAQTVDMTEREIEAAYGQRLQGRITREKTLEDMQQDVLLGVNRDLIWMTAVAMPANPRPTSSGRLDVAAMQSIITAMGYNPYLACNIENRFQYLEHRPRIGFRRWRSVVAIGDDINGAIEVYDDGGFSLAFAQYPGTESLAEPLEDGTDIHVMDLHVFAAHAVRILETVAMGIGVQGPYELQLNMVNSSGPMYLRTYRHERLVPRSRDSAIYRFHPVRILHDGTTGEESNAEVVHSLAIDLLNQGGLIKVNPVYLRDVNTAAE